MQLTTPLLSGILACFQKLGLQPSELLASEGLDEADLASPTRRIALHAMDTLWRSAMLVSDDRYLPFQVGSQMYVEQLGILGYILRNCDNVQAALLKLEKYNRLTNDFINIAHETKGKHLEIGFQFAANGPADPFLRRTFILLEFGFLAGGLPQLIHQPVKLLEARCALGLEDSQFLQAKLGCLVDEVQESEMNTIVVDGQILNAPLLLPDAALRKQLEQVADMELAKYARSETWTDKVRIVLIQTLDGEKPSVDRVAVTLHITVRALQRRLKEEGTTFQAIAEDVRKELAVRYLHQPYSVNEIAYLLGYEMPSAFSRAFRHWTGFTPIEFRQRVNA